MLSSQGLCKYVDEVNAGSKFKVLVGFDGRHNSARFATLVAAAFLQHGAYVYLFSSVLIFEEVFDMADMCPTPYVAYGTKLLGCAAGVMVTASHNPKVTVLPFFPLTASGRQWIQGVLEQRSADQQPARQGHRCTDPEELGALVGQTMSVCVGKDVLQVRCMECGSLERPSQLR
jgi:hypothetical protein